MKIWKTNLRAGSSDHIITLLFKLQRHFIQTKNDPFLIFQTYVKDDVVASRTFKRVWIRNGAKKSLTDYFLLNSSMETSSSAGIEPVTV